MKFTAAQIANYLGGTVEGNPEVELTGFGKIENGSPTHLSFLSNMKYEPWLYTTHCGAVLVNKDFVPKKEYNTTLIRVENAYECLAKLLQLKDTTLKPKPGICSSAIISPSAQVDSTAYIGEYVVIGEGAQVRSGAVVMPFTYIGDNCIIGENTTIYTHVTICPECLIGSNCIIHSGAVIGADGFGFAISEEGFQKIPQTGNVVIEDNVEIGANTCIDRASLGSTIIHKGVKLDNLVQIAHNSEVGEHTVIAAQCGIAGSVQIGKWNQLAGQVGVAGHTHTADRVTLAAQTGIISSVVDEGVVLFGSPAQPIKAAMKSMAIHRRLPELYKQICQLENKVKQLEEHLGLISEEKTTHQTNSSK